MDVPGRHLDHHLGRRRQHRTGPVDDRHDVVLLGAQRHVADVRCELRDELDGAATGDDRVAEAAADEVDGGLRLLDLDPGLRVVAGLVEEAAEHTTRTESVDRHVVSGMISCALASRAAVTGEASRSGSAEM